MNIGIIPARLNSKRLPKKILANIAGKPMIVHTMERVLMSEKLDKVILAVDSEETRKALKQFNFNIVMTSKHHRSGTDRIAEVVHKIKDTDVIINIQGDEPLVDPKVIDDLIDLFKNDDIGIATVASNNFTANDLLDPNVVKVIIDERKNAIEFKRNILDSEIGGVYRHIGMYGYRRDKLIQFTMLDPSDREKREKLEQLRALDNKMSINVLITSWDGFAVDTKDDLIKVEKVIRKAAELEIIQKN